MSGKRVPTTSSSIRRYDVAGGLLIDKTNAHFCEHACHALVKRAWFGQGAEGGVEWAVCGELVGALAGWEFDSALGVAFCCCLVWAGKIVLEHTENAWVCVRCSE